MEVLSTMLVYGIPGSLVLMLVILAMLWYNPRLMLQDYPEDVRRKVSPKTLAERRVSAYWSAVIFLLMLAFPFAAAFSEKAAHQSFPIIFLSAFGVALFFDIADLLVMDWLIVCTITPKFLVIPGTEGMAGYKNYAMHVRGFLIGIGVAVVLGLLVAVFVQLL